MSTPERVYSAIGVDGRRRLQSEYYWDGKRVWVWTQNYNHFCHVRLPDAKLHLRAAGCRDLETEIHKIKEDFAVSAALPIALHAAGDLIRVDHHTILCTEDILPISEEESGQFPLITEILDGILDGQASSFVQWLATAKAYTSGQISPPPEIACVVGGCSSAKGLLSRLTNVALSGRWRPRTFNLLTGRFSQPCPSDFANPVLLVDLSSCTPNKSTLRKFQKLLAIESSPKRVGNVDMRMRQVMMIRCHDSWWPPLESELQKIASHQFTVFGAGKEFSLGHNGERMRRDVLIERIQTEMPRFRRHLAAVWGPGTCR